MKLTHPMLRELNVGPTFLARFHSLYPDGLDLTPESLRDMVAEGFDLVWLARAVAPTPMREAERQYMDARTAAKAALIEAGNMANAQFQADDEVAWQRYHAAAERELLSWVR